MSDRDTLRRWAASLGPDPREHALLAVVEAAPRRVLDVGAGDGQFAEWCARRLSTAVVVVDQSMWLTEESADGIGGLPCCDGEFDVVAANDVLASVGELDAVLADLARVLRPGGRLVALAGSDRDLGELQGPREVSFCAENGEPVLRRHFGRVERRDVSGEVVFPTRETVRGYLADTDASPTVDIARLPEPFHATIRSAVFVAERAA